MKSSTIVSLLAVAALGLSTASFAAGRAGGQGAGTQSQLRTHTPGTGLSTGTPTQSRTGANTAGKGTSYGPAAARGAGKGIHTPGTGLTTAPTAP